MNSTQAKKERNKRYYQKNKQKLKTKSKLYRNRPDIAEKERRRFLKKSSGATLEDFNTMFENQQGYCKICGKHQANLKRALNVDHNHKTGKLRGLLCNSCNLGLGMFKDNLILLELAIKYLKENDG